MKGPRCCKPALGQAEVYPFNPGRGASLPCGCLLYRLKRRIRTGAASSRSDGGVARDLAAGRAAGEEERSSLGSLKQCGQHRVHESSSRESRKQRGQHRVHEGAHRLGERRDQIEEDDALSDDGEVMGRGLAVRDDGRVGGRCAEGDDEREEELLIRSGIEEDGHTYNGELAQALDNLEVEDALGVTRVESSPQLPVRYRPAGHTALSHAAVGQASVMPP